jgi:hypothetical protein
MSYGWMDYFRAGSWLSLRTFLLRERQNVPDRIRTIREELERIGFIWVFYDLDAEGDIKTNKRLGMTVNSPYSDFWRNEPDYCPLPIYQPTSLEKLLKAYIALGGNPLDISLFLQPDVLSYVPSDSKHRSQPSSGIQFSQTHEQGDDGGTTTNMGGFSSLTTNKINRLGYRPSTNIKDIADDVHEIRNWANREIMSKRNRIEENIIKLCDLREQLYMEASFILRTSLSGTFRYDDTNTLFMRNFNKDVFSEDHHLFKLINNMDSLIFKKKATDQSGFIYLDIDNTVFSNFGGDKVPIFTDAADGSDSNTAY